MLSIVASGWIVENLLFHGHSRHFSLIAHAQRVVEPLEHRDQADQERQLDHLRVAEPLAQAGKELVWYAIAVARHKYSVFDGKSLTIAAMFTITQIIADRQRPHDVAMRADAELAVVQLRDPQD